MCVKNIFTEVIFHFSLGEHPPVIMIEKMMLGKRPKRNYFIKKRDIGWGYKYDVNSLIILLR